jgi:predicted PurR-regulated permease PerM
MSPRSLVGALLLTAATLAGVYLLFFQLSDLFAIGFTAILVAVAVDVPTSFILRRVRVPRALALVLVTLLGLGAWVALGAWIGPQITAQFSDLQEQVQAGLRNAGDWLGANEPFRSLLRLTPSAGDVAPEAGQIVRGTQQALLGSFGFVANLLIVLFVGFFLAANPRRYEEGLLLLLPEAKRGPFLRLLAAIARALRWWLLARLLLMLFIGVLFGIGLWVLDIPLKLPLAVLAALLNFIPYVGPVLAYVPILAVSLVVGVEAALYVSLLYVSIQTIESYLAEPLIEARTVTLPPALIILAQVLCVVWLGFVGVLLATPLLITAVVTVQVLYVKRVLGEDIDVAGQR